MSTEGTAMSSSCRMLAGSGLNFLSHLLTSPGNSKRQRGRATCCIQTASVSHIDDIDAIDLVIAHSMETCCWQEIKHISFINFFYIMGAEIISQPVLISGSHRLLIWNKPLDSAFSGQLSNPSFKNFRFLSC